MAEEPAAEQTEERRRFTGPHPGPFGEEDLAQEETIPHPRREYRRQSPGTPGGSHPPDAQDETPHGHEYWEEEHPVDWRT